MEFIYGRPALPVTGPGGKTTLYLFREVDPGRGWVLTKPDGTEYAVELAADWWRCTCRDWAYRGRRRDCKHIAAIKTHLTDEETATGATCESGGGDTGGATA